MLGASKRWAHDKVRGFVPVGIAIHRVVDHEVLRKYFAEHALPFEARTRDGFKGVDARGVHHVERHPENFRDADRSIGGFPFDFGWTRQRMPFGALEALLEDLFLQVIHELAILSVHRTERAELFCGRKAIHEHFVVAHDGVLVRHEMFET